MLRLMLAALAALCGAGLASAQFSADTSALTRVAAAAGYESLRASVDPLAGRAWIVVCADDRCVTCEGEAARAVTAGWARGELAPTDCAGTSVGRRDDTGNSTGTWRVGRCGDGYEITVDAEVCTCSPAGDSLTLRPGIGSGNWGGAGPSCRGDEEISLSVSLAVPGDSGGPPILAQQAAGYGYGEDGEDGEDGTDGTHGTNGTDGTHGTNGTDGTHGTDGTDGADASDPPVELVPNLQSCGACLNASDTQWCIGDSWLQQYSLSLSACFHTNYSCFTGVPIRHIRACVTTESDRPDLRYHLPFLDRSQLHELYASNGQFEWQISYPQHWLTTVSNATTYVRPPCGSLFDVAGSTLGHTAVALAPNDTASATLAGAGVSLRAAHTADVKAAPSRYLHHAATLTSLGAAAIQNITASGPPRLVLEITNLTAAGVVAVVETRCDAADTHCAGVLEIQCPLCVGYIVGDSAMMTRRQFYVELLARTGGSACDAQSPPPRRSFLAIDVAAVVQLYSTVWVAGGGLNDAQGAPLWLGLPQRDAPLPPQVGDAPPLTSHCYTEFAPECSAAALTSSEPFHTCVQRRRPASLRTRPTNGAWSGGPLIHSSGGPLILAAAADCDNLAALPIACPLVRRTSTGSPQSVHGDVGACADGTGPGGGAEPCFCRTNDGDGNHAVAYFLPYSSDSFDLTVAVHHSGVARLPIRVGAGAACNVTEHGLALDRLDVAALAAPTAADPLAAMWAHAADLRGQHATACLTQARARLVYAPPPQQLTSSGTAFAPLQCGVASYSELATESTVVLVGSQALSADPCCTALGDGQPHDACCVSVTSTATGALQVFADAPTASSTAELHAAHALATSGNAGHRADGFKSCSARFVSPLRGWSAHRAAAAVDWCRRAVWATAAASPCLLSNGGSDCAVAPPFSALCLAVEAAAAEGVCSLRPELLNGTASCANATEDEQRRLFRCLGSRGSGLRDLPDLSAAPEMRDLETFRNATTWNDTAQLCVGPEAWAYAADAASFADPGAAWTEGAGCAANRTQEAHASRPRITGRRGPRATLAAALQWPAEPPPPLDWLAAVTVDPPAAAAAAYGMLPDFDLRLAGAAAPAGAAPRRLTAPASFACVLPPQRVHLLDSAGGLAVEVRCPNLLDDCRRRPRPLPPTAMPADSDAAAEWRQTFQGAAGPPDSSDAMQASIQLARARDDGADGPSLAALCRRSEDGLLWHSTGALTAAGMCELSLALVPNASVCAGLGAGWPDALLAAPTWQPRTQASAQPSCAAADGRGLVRGSAAECGCGGRTARPAAEAAAADAVRHDALPLAGAATLSGGEGCGVDYGRLAAAVTRHVAATAGHRVRQLLQCELAGRRAAHRLLAGADAAGAGMQWAANGSFSYRRSCLPALQNPALWTAHNELTVLNATAAGACAPGEADRVVRLTAQTPPTPAVAPIGGGGALLPASPCIGLAAVALSLSALPSNDTLTVCYAATNPLGPRCAAPLAKCLKMAPDGTAAVVALSLCNVTVAERSDGRAAVELEFCVTHGDASTSTETVCLDTICPTSGEVGLTPPKRHSDLVDSLIEEFFHVRGEKEQWEHTLMFLLVVIVFCGLLRTCLKYACKIGRLGTKFDTGVRQRKTPVQPRVSETAPLIWGAVAQQRPEAQSSSRARARQRRASPSPQPAAAAVDGATLQLPRSWTLRTQ